jgi:hypothetical protein
MSGTAVGKNPDVSASIAVSEHDAAENPHAFTAAGLALGRCANLAAQKILLEITAGGSSFQGVIDCAANPNFPEGDAGDYYAVSVAGKIGGASGQTVAVGDLVFCVEDSAGGLAADVGYQWTRVLGSLCGAAPYSATGTTWTEETAPAGSLSAICYGNGVFVLLADDGTTRCWTSPDAITWTAQTIGARTWAAVCYGNSVFVAVSLDGYVATSPTGVTWTEQTPASTKAWADVCWSGSLFVAVANSAEDQYTIMTSPTGETWTGRTCSGLDRQFTNVIALGSIFLAFNKNSGLGDYDYSTDAINWTQQNPSGTPVADVVGVTKNATQIIVVVGDEGNYRQAVYYTTNGIDWTVAGPSTNNGFGAVAFGANLIVASFKRYADNDMGIGATPATIVHSNQGTTSGWDTNGRCRVAYGNKIFVVLPGPTDATTYLRCDD